jgi:hypothetical protein
VLVNNASFYKTRAIDKETVTRRHQDRGVFPVDGGLPHRLS